MGRVREWTRQKKLKLLEQLGGTRNKSSSSLPAPTMMSPPQNSEPHIPVVSTKEPMVAQLAKALNSTSANGLLSAPNPGANATSTISLPNQLGSRSQTPIANSSTTKAPSSIDVPSSTAGTNEKMGKERMKEVAWTGAKTLLGLLEASADAFGPLKSAIGGLNRCIQIFEKAAKGQKDYEELGEKLNQLLSDLFRFKENLNGPAITTSLKNLCSGIEVELSVVEQKQKRNKAERLAEAMDDSGDILECYRRIQGHLERLTERRLHQLCPTMAGAYNSGSSHSVKRGPCTEGTREPELKKLKDWAHDPLAEATYWLDGMAGTGKTTISYSLCTELDFTGKLAASFFCSRSKLECRSVELIIPTIAYQLARFSHPFRHALSKALELDPDSHTRALDIQFQKLVVDPLEEVQHALPSDFIVVVDALDECEDRDSIGTILDLLVVGSSSASKLPVRFLISSRPEPEIYNCMMERVGGNANANLVLHKLDPVIVRHDVEKYLRNELSKVPLTTFQWSGLVERCGVLFIYASTAVRYIKEGHKMKNHEEAVNMVLGLASFNPEESMEALNGLYTTILDAAFGDKSQIRKVDKERMRNVLHTVICAQEPMAVEVLASLLGLKSGEQVDALLGPLRSVVHTIDSEDTRIATTLHASFPDFLLNIGRSGDIYHCEAISRHNDLALACLQQIRLNNVQFNICDLESSYLLDSSVDSPEMSVRANRAVSSTFSYACRYWAAHLDLGGQLIHVQAPLYDFLSARLLLWIEVLNVTKCLGIGIGMIKRAEDWCQRKDAPKEITELAHDAWQFVFVYANYSVSQSTPHIYTSMLPFWPDSHPLTKHYTMRTADIPLHQSATMARQQLALLATWSIGKDMTSICYFPNGAQVIVAAENDIYVLDGWTGNVAFGPLQGHTERINSVAISPNGSMIASGSEDKTIRIWDAKTGKLVGAPLQGHKYGVFSVAFSPDSTRIVSTGADHTPRIWFIQTGECTTGTISKQTSAVCAAVFSADGSYVVSGDLMGTLSFWDTNGAPSMTDEPLQGHSTSIYSVACSLDGSCMVSAGGKSNILVWDTKSRHQPVLLGSLEGHKLDVKEVIFSPDGKYIASCSSDNTVCIWHAESQKLVTSPLEGHTAAVASIAFSPDSNRLASCSYDGTIRIWNMRHLGKTTGVLGGHASWVRSVRFSSDGSQVVTGGDDCSVCLWDSHNGDLILGPLKGHTSFVYSVDISPDGSCIASASNDTLRLWDVKDGKGISKILEDAIKEPGWVRFSPEGSLVLFGSKDKDCKVYSVGGLLNVPDMTSGSFTDILGACDIQDFGKPRWRHCRPDFQSLPEGGKRIVDFNDGNRVREFALTLIPLSLLHEEPLTWHAGGLFNISFSPERLYAVSGCDNGAIQLWNVQNGQPMNMAPLEGHTNSVQLVQFSPDGSRIVSCSFDNTIRFWTVPAKEELEKYKPSDAGSTTDAQNHSLIIPPVQAWTINKDGWVINSQGDLLIWVPQELRTYLLRPRNDVLISNRGSVELKFDGTNIGKSWTKCYTPANVEILD